MIPQIIRVNQYIQKIAEKIVEIPIIIETMKEVVREQERIVPIKNQTTEIVEVERIVEKLVYA
jgi:dihydrodipicolinate synthase/N-acetylneuraminate lyase